MKNDYIPLKQKCPIQNENDTYGLRYAEFVVPLTKAVQELSAENAALKKEILDPGK